VLLLQAQRLFERVGVRLVHLERSVLFADPGFRIVEAGLPLAGGDLFDANGDLHGKTINAEPAELAKKNRPLPLRALRALRSTYVMPDTV
jgi:hypothetical protein